jgi:hypothetical protein
MAETLWKLQDQALIHQTFIDCQTIGILRLRDALMKTLNDALALLDAAELEIERLRPSELRDAIEGYASCIKALINALSRFDRSLPSAQPPPRKPTLVLVRSLLH